MNKQLLLSGLTSLALTAGAFAQDGDRKVRIEITRTEDGKTSHSEHEFDLDDQDALENALRELGVLDEFNVIDDGENIVIDVRRLKDGGLLEDMSMALAFEKAMEEASEPVAWFGAYLANYNEAKEEGNVAEAPVENAAVLTKIVAGSPADEAGFKDGDVVVEVDGVPIPTSEALRAVIKDHEPGDQVRVAFYREGVMKRLNVTLGEREEERAFVWEFDDKDADWDSYYGDTPPAPKAFLGVEGGSADEGGVRISKVIEGSSAEKMGLEEGDVVRKINGEEVGDFDELAELIGGLEPGSAVKLDISREGKKKSLSGELGQRDMKEFRFYGMPPMPPPPPPPSAPGEEDVFYFRGLPQEEREELRREMDELRIEMEMLRQELGGEVTRQMRVVIGSYTLNDEEKELLEQKGAVDLDNALEVGEMKLFPNPSDGFFRVQFDVAERGDLEVDVHDANGERIYHETITGYKGRYERTLDLSDRADGTYFLVVRQNGRALARKLVKQ